MIHETISIQTEGSLPDTRLTTYILDAYEEQDPGLKRPLVLVCPGGAYRFTADRGQETDESDIDMALVLKANQTDEQYDQLTDVVVDYELDIGITLSIISIEKNEFKEWKNTLPFYKKLAKEGIVLWKNE